MEMTGAVATHHRAAATEPGVTVAVTRVYLDLIGWLDFTETGHKPTF